MPVRTKCVVIGRELHGALGTSTVPPPPVPFTPSNMSFWLSASPTHYGCGDLPVPDVIICGEPAVNKGADTKYRRPHLVVIGMLPPTVLVGPVVDLGFIILVIAVGCTKPIWGPSSVQAGAKSIAVIGIPYSPVSPINQLICSDPCDLPIGISVQMPSSVFVGMTLGDYLKCLVSIAVDMLLSFILNLIFGGLEFLGNFISKRLLQVIEKSLGPKLLKVFGKGLANVTEKITEFLIKKFGKELGTIFGKGVEETAKKIAGAYAGGLSPDGLLGFGSGTRTNPLSPKLPE
jgi:hypothetical protein